MERAFCSQIAYLAGCRMGIGHSVAAHAGQVLCTGGQVELPFCRLRDCAVGSSVVRRAALPKLVPAQNPQAGNLEGSNLPRIDGNCYSAPCPVVSREDLNCSYQRYEERRVGKECRSRWSP